MDMSNSPRFLPADCGRAKDSGAGVVQIDPAASAALEAAIKSAREGLKPTAAQAEPTAVEVPIRADATGHRNRLLLQAAAAILLIGAGWAASFVGALPSRDAMHRLEAETVRNRETLSKLADDLAALKSTMAAARDVDQTASTTSASDQAKLVQKVDRLAAAIEAPGPRLTALEGRIDRLQSEIIASLNALTTPKPAVVTNAVAAVPEPAQDNAPAVKPAKTEPVDGWVLREVYNGSALVEGRNRGLYEVMPGNIIPGVGRVEAIERRGARWVVVTDKGFISTYR